MNKPILARIRAFIDPKDIKVAGQGTEDETHEFRYDVTDEFRVYPSPFSNKAVWVEFDGGHIEVSRSEWLDYLKAYEEIYEQRVHHEAVDELTRAAEGLRNPKQVNHYKAMLKGLRDALDKREAE